MAELSGNQLIAKEMAEGLPEADVEEQFVLDLFANPLDARKNVVGFSKELRRRGRPKGSMNKAVLANKEYCEKKGYVPFLDVVGMWSSSNPLEISKILGCSVKDAMTFYQFMVGQYGDYTEKKQPRMLDVKSESKAVILKKTIFKDMSGNEQEIVETEKSAEISHFLIEGNDDV